MGEKSIEACKHRIKAEENKWWDTPGSKLVIARSSNHNDRFTPAPVGEKSLKMSWRDLCTTFDLEEDFNLPTLSRRGKYLAVRNGVPLRMGMKIAAAIKNLMAGEQPVTRICICGCGRPIAGTKQTLATPACRKRMERWRRGTNQKELYFK